MRLSGRSAARSQREEKVTEHTRNIGTEIADYRKQRTQMNGDIESEPLVLIAQEPGGQDQMCRAGDGQEFGKALYQREDKNLNGIHKLLFIACLVRSFGVRILGRCAELHQCRSRCVVLLARTLRSGLRRASRWHVFRTANGSGGF